MTIIVQAPHPRLLVRAFVTVFPADLATLQASDAASLLRIDAPAPVTRNEDVRRAVRDALRHWGFKPTGRGKPASEYLVRAAEEGTLAPINAAVDACNAVSLHSGLPISVVDLDRLDGSLHIAAGAAGERYVFNAAGQEIDVTGLACLYDSVGPCANAVKDSQRTKTGPATTRTLSVIWGTAAHADLLDSAVSWYRSLLEEIGAATSPCDVRIRE